MNPRGASEPAVVDMTDAGFWQDPHGALRGARQRSTLARTGSGEFIVLDYADVERLASDPRTKSNALDIVERHVADGPLVEWWRRMLTNLNGPEHIRLRGLVSRAFTPRSVDAARPRMRKLSREILARHFESGELDVLHDFAHELPIRLMCELLGVPEEHHDDFSRWSTSLGDALSSVPTPELIRDGESAVEGMGDAIQKMLQERRHQPRDDLLTALLQEASGFEKPVDDAALVVLVINLIFGGHDTSRGMLAIAVALLVAHPGELRRLRASPALAASAGDEVLRYEPLVPVMAREAREDLEVAGEILPAGSTFLLSILAANRDPKVFSDPDRFDIRRNDPHSFSFGWSAHRCLGAALARAEIQEVIPEFFACCRRVELRIDEPRWVPFANLRRIEALPVRFEPADSALPVRR